MSVALQELTGAQRETITGLMAGAGPGSSFVADRDEPQDSWVFLCIYQGRALVLETIVEADGSQPQDG
jgi:hypothetical protein